MYNFQKSVEQTNNMYSMKERIGQQDSYVNRMKTTLILGAVCLALSACSVSSTTDSLSEENTIITKSVTRDVEPQGVASEDAELIKTVVADAENASSPNVLAWSNPETGSRGTITAINKFTGSHGQKCKKFQTTVDTFMGISLYNGETCELKKGFWVLSWFLREDS